MSIRIGVIAGLLLLMLSSCESPESGIGPIGAIPEVPLKQLIYNEKHFVDVICHIDVNEQNPLNVKDYYFDAREGIPEIPFFNYVVLGHAYLVKDTGGRVSFEYTPDLQYILNNNQIFLRPLREKGIKILIELRSGNFADDEVGDGIGLGTMDMAAIEAFIHNFTLPINRYGIDGFEFNDVGGGYKSYPPHTRDLKRYESDIPLYPDILFMDSQGEPITDQELINNILWREGGNNFDNLVYKAYEIIKDSQTVTADYGASAETNNQTIEIKRTLLVRNQGHGGHLLYQIRPDVLPDAYTGQNVMVTGNLTYIINAVSHDTTAMHPSMYDETDMQDAGERGYVDEWYAPFNIDLLDRREKTDAEALARMFAGTSASPNKYGAVYCSNLPPVSADFDPAAYLSYFSQEIFGRRTRLYENGGTWQKNW